MSRSAKITLDWADGTYDFKLGFAELEELDEKTKVGPLVLFNRLAQDGDWHVNEVREVLRIGLIGGGTKPADALRLVRRYVDDVPDWITNVKLAASIVGAAMSGWDDESLGKSGGAKATTEQTGGSPSRFGNSPQWFRAGMKRTRAATTRRRSSLKMKSI
jgi:hypothetical protein